MRKLQAKTLMEILPENISKVVHQKLEQQGASPEFMTVVGMVSYYTAGNEIELNWLNLKTFIHHVSYHFWQLTTDFFKKLIIIREILNIYQCILRENSFPFQLFFYTFHDTWVILSQPGVIWWFWWTPEWLKVLDDHVRSHPNHP